MRDKVETYQHERLGLQFLSALQRGDAARLADLWHQAETDPATEALFEELLAGEADADEADAFQTDQSAKAASALDAEPRPPGRNRPSMPPLPTVVVRHRLDDLTTTAFTAPAVRREEPSNDAGSFKEIR